jgi:hypothetical protein
MAVQIQFRRDTAANWTSANPTLAVGELGLETDSKLFKIGDGSTAWTSLSYAALSVSSLTGVLLQGSTREKVTVVGTGFAGYAYDVTTSGEVQYITANSTASGTVNFRSTSAVSLNTLMAIGESVTATLLVTNGTTAYYPTAWQIDGSAVTPKWLGGTAPTAGNASAIDIYTVTIIKTASATFTVLASQTKAA